ncbi:MAG: V-type ATPase subunit [Spirochaetales bacterium]|nr:V-type ATPase subunit [Spirochaetales bacterium]
MASPIAQYGFINAKLRARISKIVTEEFISQLVKSRSLMDCLSLLKDTDFAIAESVFSKTGDLKMCELALQKQEITLFAEMRRYVKDEVLGLTAALTLQFEIMNLKNAVRLWFDRVIRQRPVDIAIGYILRETIINTIDFDRIINADSMDAIIEILRGTPYDSIFENQKEWVLQNSSLFRLEIALDQYFYKQLFAQIEKLNRRDQTIAKRLFSVQIDLLNISWLVRFRTLYNLPLEEAMQLTIPYGLATNAAMVARAYKTEDITDIIGGTLKNKYSGVQSILGSATADKASKLELLDQILTQILYYEVRHILAGYPFTIGIILAYFILKQDELRKIVTILNAKNYNMNEERLSGRL